MLKEAVLDNASSMAAREQALAQLSLKISATLHRRLDFGEAAISTRALNNIEHISCDCVYRITDVKPVCFALDVLQLCLRVGTKSLITPLRKSLQQARCEEEGSALAEELEGLLESHEHRVQIEERSESYRRRKASKSRPGTAKLAKELASLERNNPEMQGAER